jgi:excisionase family DNA binding protein
MEKLAYTLKEAAPRIGVSVTSLRRAIDRGQLRACRKFRHILITKQELESFLGIKEAK